MALRAIYDVVATAKLNLFLHVVGRRADGYHLLESLFVPIDWCDTLHFEARPDKRITRHDLGAALPDDDLCLRAARALQQASGTTQGVDIAIDKRIPSGAGMGGGSSDAASTLLALSRLWALHWPLDRLTEIGLTIGADVPFFLGGGPAFVEGVGERLTPVALPPRWFAVIKPVASLETRAIFQSPLLGHSAKADIVEGFTDRGFAGFFGHGETAAEFGRNDLQAAAEAASAEVAAAAALLKRSFGNSRMTGSGSAVFADAGSAAEPDGAMPDKAMPAGWTGRMCRSLSAHPLAGWTE